MGKQLRKELGLPDHAVILGHIGRFTPQKNHRFLLELMEFLQNTPQTQLPGNTKENRDKSWYAVLVGQGESWEAIRREIYTKNLRDRVILTGFRPDIPDLFCSLFDVFLLPSCYEGLPVAAMEALAAGLGVVYSDRISCELDNFFPQRVRRVSLEAPKTCWHEAILEMLAARCETPFALAELSATPFTIQSSLEQLISLYFSRLETAGF
ncbi:MAG: glycosyltransferase [Planctomycetaceae bacterium]|jgi:glycosyltransferase involved in cell wall biosynthesis|nr:glycosyltransferase [Planctomycetaceae bacterium]